MHRFLIAKAKPGTSTESVSSSAVASAASETESGTAQLVKPKQSCSSKHSQSSSSCTSTVTAIPFPVARADVDLGLNNTAPSQPANLVFPKRDFGKTTRSFCPGWYRGRPWLEYSAKLDACFCFPCRKFGGNNDRDLVFTKQGFRNEILVL